LAFLIEPPRGDWPSATARLTVDRRDALNLQRNDRIQRYLYFARLEIDASRYASTAMKTDRRAVSIFLRLAYFLAPTHDPADGTEPRAEGLWHTMRS
jgi:hypothetical protein